MAEPNRWTGWVAERLAAIDADDRRRRVVAFDAVGPVGHLADGAELVSFASNDYLGLTHHPAVTAAAVAAVRRWGTGSGASRLVVGSRPVHHELEGALAAWKGTEAALLFPTGYAANLGVLSALAGPGVRICSDELNHASIIDGCRLAAARGAEIRVYPHGDVEALARLLDGPERSIVVTDGVFSMDGDVAPWAALGSVCARPDTLVVVDEAHVVLDPLPALDGVELVRVGTLSKTLGSLGGFVAASHGVVELLLNTARSFVFTTAPSPPDTAAAAAALGVLRSPAGRTLVERLRRHVDTVRPGHPTPIIPVVVGSERAALDLSTALRSEGLLVPAIRPPTVPPGTSRLRIALSADHTDDQVAALVEALDRHGLR